MTFDNLGLRAELLRAIEEQGYSEPTPIQRKAIPIVLQGQDVMAGAQTGTGKTAGFTLPLLQRLSASPSRGSQRPVRALILTPTRELAAQVGESVELYGRHLPLRSAVIFGGVKINPQIKKLRHGVDILIATPGRLLDHVGQKTVDLSQVEILVLDEADRMLDMGFIHDIRKVLALLPQGTQRQTLLFSATFSPEIKQLANRLLHNPELIEVARQNATAEGIRQRVYPVDKARKQELLSYMIGSRNWHQVLVFTRTKHGANRLTQQLEKDGLTAAAIHGNKSQGARTRALAAFKNGDLRVLVATDIAARGIDIAQLPHVVNYELPNVPEDYVHRIGRTGRAGSEGEAISLVCVDELKLLRDIERLVKRDIPQEILPGYEPDLTIPPEPIQNGRNGRGGGRGGRDGGRAGGDRLGGGSRSGRSGQTAPRRSAGASGESRSPSRSPAGEPAPSRAPSAANGRPQLKKKSDRKSSQPSGANPDRSSASPKPSSAPQPTEGRRKRRSSSDR
ncbi:MAG: DEAD/DEAH box helicase [Synechococcales cyanobacterium RM1_1_8]|nr:DEAD/DEAH box helicase [Synechococcales cyanobacterium RM1_1_8]